MTQSYSVAWMMSPEGMYMPKPYRIGGVEFRPPTIDSPQEREALKNSQASFSENDSHQITMRACTIVEAESLNQSFFNAEPIIEEALDIVSINSHGVGRFQLRNAAFSREMGTGQIFPRSPHPSLGPSTIFRIQPWQFEPLDFPQSLAINKTDLGERLRRSLHWARKSQWEPNLQLRLLHHWFSMEAIWSIHRDDDVCPRVRWVLGFPCGRGLRSLSPDFIASLNAIENYDNWNKYVAARVDKIRELRNAIVHNGLRLQDIPVHELREYAWLGVVASARTRGLVQRAMGLGIKDASTLDDNLHTLIELEGEGYVSDVRGTIIYSLENSHYRLG